MPISLKLKPSLSVIFICIVAYIKANHIHLTFLSSIKIEIYISHYADEFGLLYQADLKLKEYFLSFCKYKLAVLIF